MRPSFIVNDSYFMLVMLTSNLMINSMLVLAFRPSMKYIFSMLEPLDLTDLQILAS